MIVIFLKYHIQNFWESILMIILTEISHNHVKIMISRNVGVITRLRHIININIIRNLYYTLIYPYIHYCNMIWASTYFYNLLPILKITKKDFKNCYFFTF